MKSLWDILQNKGHPNTESMNLVILVNLVNLLLDMVILVNLCENMKSGFLESPPFQKHSICFFLCFMMILRYMMIII